MMWILINTVDCTVAGGPFADKPAAAAGMRAVECALGYPDTVEWSPEACGFIDIVRPLYTFAEWLDLFSEAQQLAIVGAAMVSPAAKLFYDRTQSQSGEIDPRSSASIAGLSYFVSRGWIDGETFTAITGAAAPALPE